MLSASKSYMAKPDNIAKKWLVIDARSAVLGRLASTVAMILKGKHKATYTPHMDCGDNVIIINAEHVKLTGGKLDKNKGKIYYRHTGYPGGIKADTAGKMLAGPHPERVIIKAVKGMLARNKLSRTLLSNLYVYAGSEHVHQGQKPEIYDFISQNPKNSRG